MGAITFGQSKDLVLPLPYGSVSQCEFSLVYDTLQEKRKLIKFNINNYPDQTALRLLNQNKFRLQFVHCVRTTLEALREKQKHPTSTNEQSEAALNQLKALENEMKNGAYKNDEFVKDLLIDLTGQVQEAISREDWFKKWGVHFLPSLTRKFNH